MQINKTTPIKYKRKRKPNKKLPSGKNLLNKHERDKENIQDQCFPLYSNLPSFINIKLTAIKGIMGAPQFLN